MPMKTLMYISGPGGARELENHFPEFKFPMLSGNVRADVVEREVSRAEGLKWLYQCHDIDLERAVAFEGSMNDYGIVRGASIDVAVGNSVGELKTVAGCVIDGTDWDGIWKTCRHFSLI